MAEPPTVITGERGFPRSVLRDRHPEILTKVLDGLPYPPTVRHALGRLAEEIEGPVSPVAPDLPQARQWDGWIRPYLGRTWYEMPFLLAENLFYRKLLEATGWFGPGAWQGADPFAPQKDAELAGDAVRAELEALDRLGELPPDRLLDSLLTSALWGNRADLGFQIQMPMDVCEVTFPGSGVIADDRRRLISLLSRGGRLILVTDNIGRELLPDLVLADHLLATGTRTVDLHVKPSPYFTSDATPADVLKTVQRLADGPRAASALGDRLWAVLADGRLNLVAHPFYVAPLTFDQAPADLRKLYAEADLTLLKGDLNYRRLVGDVDRPATTPFADVTGYWPGPVAALRTLKSDVLVGVDSARLADLDATGETWRTSGHYAVIQVRA